MCPESADQRCVYSNVQWLRQFLNSSTFLHKSLTGQTLGAFASYVRAQEMEREMGA